MSAVMPSAKEEFDELMRDKGHRTNHPEDDDARSFLNISDDETAHSTLRARKSADSSDDDSPPPPPRPSMSTTRIPHKRYGANTGPKGVIADAQDFRDSQRQYRMSTQSLAGQSSAIQAPSNRLQEESDDELEEELNDDFMNSWRASRLAQLRNGAYDSDMQKGRKKGDRIWGSVQKVDTDGFLNAVDGSGQDTVVAVYIYDENSEVSELLEECIRELARKHLAVRFIKLDYRDAEMEPAGIPALLAYKNGDMFSRLVPLVEDIPEDADVCALTLEVLFKRYQILS